LFVYQSNKEIINLTVPFLWIERSDFNFFSK
jgi:hypothetical protein